MLRFLMVSFAFYPSLLTGQLYVDVLAVKHIQ